MKPECKGCAAGCVALPNELQPYGETIRTTDGIEFREMHIPRVGTLVPQHSHTYDHTTMLVKGAVSYWIGDTDMGVLEAPAFLHVAAHTKHKFLSLEDDTILYCIHNLSHTGKIEITEEHQIVGVI